MIKYIKGFTRTRSTADGYVKPAADSILGDEIKSFELEAFNAEQFVKSKCQLMSEKLIRRLCVELAEHKRLSSLEMQRNVFENYKAFIGTAREIEDLEGELKSMKSLLSSQATLIQISIDTPSIIDASDLSNDAADYPEDELDFQEFENRLNVIPDALDVALAERQVDLALRLLQQGEELVKSGSLDTRSSEGLKEAIQSRRIELTEQLSEVALQPSVRGSELRSAVSALRNLGESCKAHSLLLRSHGQKLRIESQPLKPSSTFYSGAYARSFSKLVFSAIARAAKDSFTVFGGDASFASELVLWAHSETEWCAEMLTKHVLSPAANSGSLRSVGECLQIVLGHCQLLEDQGLSLSPVLYRSIRPFVDKGLEKNISRILDSVVAVAVADSWAVPNVISLTGSGRPKGSAAQGLRLTPSADRLLSMVQEFLEDVMPVIHLQMTVSTLDGVLHLFEEYMAMLNKALMGDDAVYDADGLYSVRRAQDEKQQLALISNALILSEEIPRLAAKLTGTSATEREIVPQRPPMGPGLMRADSFAITRSSEMKRNTGGSASMYSASTLSDPKRQQLQQWRKQLVRSVDNLKVALCTQKATDLLYSDDSEEEPNLPSLYFFMDQRGGDPEGWRENPMPSDPLQQFFWTTLSFSKAATDVLAGRERLVTQLLTQFAVALLTLVCHNEMWEDSSFFVGPIGLQQFLLDIHFLNAVSVKFHFASRQLRDIGKTSMDRAREVFDVENEIMDDAEFAVMARDAISKLLQTGGTEFESSSPRSNTGSLLSDEGKSDRF